MLFSSLTFLIVFLPSVLLIYYGLLRKSLVLQNGFLAVVSLLFYAWGEPVYVLLMLGSIFLNWLLGIAIVKAPSKSYKKLILVGAVTINMFILFVFKYADFLLGNVNGIFHMNLPLSQIALPIGISFFTFQAMSYVIDVYRDENYVQYSIVKIALYISLFAQLIAGPIVRYHDIALQINTRSVNLASFSEGMHRFLLGLFKKVLIANNVALVADYVFNQPDGLQLPFYVYWIGAVAYMLQIYFDFSGYSDMAIGLGKLFGFDFLENFNYPYISKSVSEFWNRWHMSLGAWFRDYLYFPLGGSRVKTKRRLVFNLAFVWLFTGIWHGANWTFIIWGIYHGFFVTLEKLFPRYKIKNAATSHMITLVIILFGWIIFRAPSVEIAWQFIMHMFTFASSWAMDGHTAYMMKSNALFLMVGMLFSMPLKLWIEKRVSLQSVYQWVYIILFLLMLLLTMSSLVKSNYNPFIYFNF